MVTKLLAGEETRPHHRTRMARVTCLFFLLLPALGVHAQGTPAEAPLHDAHTAQRLVIPDGTPVQFRLAQGLLAGQVVRHAPATKPGDQVRLVVAADVLVEGRIVIARGSVARATVVSAIAIQQGGIPWGFASAGATGSVELKLDWVEAITGEEGPLRTVTQGPPEARKTQEGLRACGKKAQGLRGERRGTVSRLG